MTRYADPGILQRTEVYAARPMLKAAEPVMVLQLASDNITLPKNKSDTIALRRPVPLDPVTTPLAEGVTPNVTPFRYETIRGTIQQYGQVMEITDKVELLHEDPVLMDMVKQLGKNVGRTNEQLMWGELRSGTNVFYSNGATRSAVNAPATEDLLQNVTQELQTQHAEIFTEVIGGSVLINTTPIEPSYIAFAHVHLEDDIRKMPSFRPAAEYGNRRTLHPMELGKTSNRVRWVLSPDLPPYYNAGGAKAGQGGHAVKGTQGANADVYPIIVCGKGAYACIPLRGMRSVEPRIVPVDTISKSDPLAQRGYAGTKWWFLCRITNDLWMARLEVAATDLLAARSGA